jgi:hypothetical protein
VKAPPFVTAGLVDYSAEIAAARFRAQRIARKIRAHVGRLWGRSTVPARLNRLCNVYCYPSPFPVTVASLAQDLRHVRADIRHLYVTP